MDPPEVRIEEVAPALQEGRYHLVRRLGEGGMAIVYRGWDERLEVFRAIKVLSPALSRSQSVRRRFEAEARTMARLHHANIVTVHDVATDGDRSFIVMELVEGGSLWDRVRVHGPLAPRVACEVVAALLSALEIAHREGVVHRDIKPHNVLLGRDGTAKLSDFGIAQVQDGRQHTRTGSVMGTLAYMAPEQRTDSKSVGPAADLYAVGGTLYAVVTGRDPFDLHGEQARADLLIDLPGPIRVIVERACNYRPEDRFASAAEMKIAVLAAAAAVDGPMLRAAPLVIDDAADDDRPLAGASATLDLSELAPGPPVALTASQLPTQRGSETMSDAVHQLGSTLPSDPPPGTPAPAPRRVARSRAPLFVAALVAAGVAFGAGAIAIVAVGWSWSASSGAAAAPIEAPPASPEPVIPEPAPIPAPTVPVSSTEPAPVAAAAPVPAPATTRDPPIHRVEPHLASSPAPTAPLLPVATPPEPADPPILQAVATLPDQINGDIAGGVRLFVNTRPAGRVTVDGTDAGSTPFDRRLPVGHHTVVLHRVDGQGDGVTRSFDLNDGSDVRFCWDFAAGAPCSR